MILELIQVPPIVQVNTDNGRFYETPSGGRYPSVSTILGEMQDKTFLTEWRAKVGDEVADKISKKATTRGTLIHENIENFLLSKPSTFNMFHTEEKEMYNNVLPVLKTIEKVVALETQLWSDKLECAGTIDCAAVIGGRLKAIDWKTSGRIKNRNEIHNYFMQVSMYAYMIYERTGISISDILIVMTTQDDGVILFEEKVQEWLPKAIEVRAQFRERRGF